MQQLGGPFTNIPNTTEDICKNDGRENFDLVSNSKDTKFACGIITSKPVSLR
jgi:hypothetical protein